MKKEVFVLLSLLLIVGNVMAQTKTDLYKEWKVKGTGLANEFWLMDNTAQQSLDFVDTGRFFTFKEDGTYNERASARCGLDDDRYYYSGKWSYHPTKKIIELKEIKVVSARPQIYNNYKVFSSGSLQIISYEGGNLKVGVEKSWEKVSEKK